MTKDDIIRMAREAGMPLGIRLINSVQSESCVSAELERFAALVAAAEREACAKLFDKEHALHELSRLGQEIEQEPNQWREMVVVSLVREGINKHRARELADHFAAQPEQEPVAWMVTYGGLTHVEYTLPSKVVDTHYQPLYTTPPAAQRTWVGLEIEEVQDSYNADYQAQTRAVEKLLKERNT